MRLSAAAPALLALALSLAGCGGASPASSASAGGSIATYSGGNRQQRLEAGARAEGKLDLYTSTVASTMDPLVAAFKARYPFVQVDMLRADNDQLIPRIVQEEQAGKHIFDTLATTTDAFSTLIDANLLQPFSSPELAAFPKDSVEPRGYWAPVYETYIGLGYNTKAMTAEQAPRTYDDLADPALKGKMTIAGSSTGVRLIGALVQTRGEAFVRQLGSQQIRVQNVSARALADLVVSGEVPVSPTIFDSHVADSKAKGAPIAWVPLEPVVANLNAAAMSRQAPHPNAALLFLDFVLSDAGQQVYRAHGDGSPRLGPIGGITFKKLYLDNVVQDYPTEFGKWQQLLHSVFT
jgi:iron(III) transport system substrate-binding protein